MSENRNRGIRDFSEYDSMPTKELEEILRLDAEAPEGQESDTEILLYVMGVLADRRRNAGHTGKTALEAYESFKQNYLPEVEDIETAPETGPNKRIPLRRLRSLTAAAAVLAIVFLGAVTANSFGFNFWDTIAKWTQETFHFASWGQTEASEPAVDDEFPYASLQDAMEGFFTEPIHVPTWIPDGYSLADILITENPVQKTCIALYQNGEKAIQIAVYFYSDDTLEEIERSDDFIETYDVSGTLYYIFSNNARMQAVWKTGSYECHILGDLTIEQLKMMIDSIEKG